MNQKIEKVKRKTEPKRKIFLNTIKAFVSGGIICLIAEAINEIIINYLKVNKDISNTFTVIIMVFLGAILTAIGVYDKIGQHAGCGSIIPITGFANSMTSAGLEYKSEGLIMGIFTNMFKLAGSVIAVGVVSGVIIGTIRYIFKI